MHSSAIRPGHVGRGCALAAAIGLVLIAGCGLAAHLYDRHWEKKVEARLAEYRAAGQPVTWAEVLAARQPIPDDENSALVLLEAFKQLVPPEGRCEEILVYASAGDWTGGARHSEEMRGLVEEYLGANRAALDTIRRAAVFPRGSYPLDPVADPIFLNMDHVVDLLHAVRLSDVEAAYHAEAPDVEQAVKSLVEGRRMIASIGDDTTAVEGLVKTRTAEQWIRAAQHTLELCQVPAEGLRALRDEMAQGEADLSLELVFRGGRCEANYDYYSAVAVADVSPSKGQALVWRLYNLIPARRHKDDLLYYDLLDGAADICRLPLRDRREAAQRLEAESERKMGWSKAMYDLPLRSLPWIARDFEFEAEAHATLRVGDAALAVEQWRLAHGRWPDSVDELLPELLAEVPDDPFCDDKIRYRRTDDGVVVYSVGPDGQDDNGTPQEEATDDRYDIPFRLLDPELRGARTLTFRDEVMDTRLRLEELEEAGYTAEKLQALGFSEEDIKKLGGP